MDNISIFAELNRNKLVFAGLLKGLTKTEYLWKQSAEKWCLLEIICHLYDEEREDFRIRTRHILVNSQTPFPPINPVGWVQDRKYLEQDFADKLNNFIKEREKSLKWLESLDNKNWGNFYKHPLFGEITAAMLLANWLAHDYIHIRQIITLKYAFIEKKSGKDISYAGDW